MTAPVNDFAQTLAWSKGRRSDDDCATIANMLDGTATVAKCTDRALDARGVDYVATLRRGARVLIDAKGRRRGAARFWRYGEPELALETDSVITDYQHEWRIGWTLDESKVTDLILYHFEDVDECYLIGFQHLRVALRRNYHLWTATYDWLYEDNRDPATGREWRSRAVFVPASIVIGAVAEVSSTRAA